MVNKEGKQLSLLDILGGGIIYEEVAQTIKDLLVTKYGKEFEIKKIGRSYGTNYSGTITTFCCPKDEEDVLFTVVLKADKVNYTEDYPLRSICTELEKDFNKCMSEEKIISCIRIDTASFCKLDKCISLEKFIQLNKDIEFFVDIYIKGKTSKTNIKKAIEKFKKDNKIKFNGNITYLEEEYFDEFNNIANGIPGNQFYSCKTQEVIDKLRISEVIK